MTHEIVDIGARRELFVDTWLAEALSGGAALRLHHPTPRGEALVTDQPWEGNMCGYATLFRDGDKRRLYYHTGHFDPQLGFDTPQGMSICYAESSDGITWRKPALDLFPFPGHARTNIVTLGGGPEQKGVHGFAPFRDACPHAAPEARYKALGACRAHTTGALYALISPDGLRWSLLQDGPVMTDGAFDSQNLAFWDSLRGEYRAYIRDFRNHRRGIRTCTSPDFVHWSAPQWLEYGDAPDDQLYTNQVLPYERAPHLFVGFPSRYVERPWSPTIEDLPEPEERRIRNKFHPRYGAAITDGLFMSSRDGLHFHRWGEAFIRPGPQTKGNWVYGDNYQCWGLIETPSERAGAPAELSFVASEHYWRGQATIFRRYTLRLDGFCSIAAPMAGGEIVTRPLRFEGSRLHLNIATSAAGGAWVELQDPQGQAIPGYALEDCYEIVGDEIERAVRWRGGVDVAALAGRPVRLRIVLRDTDLYALRFG